jgi:hypothetical protein
VESAYFVFARRGKTPLLTPPQHSSPLGLVLAALAHANFGTAARDFPTLAARGSSDYVAAPAAKNRLRPPAAE